jgi:phage-related protein (TIGR01555 family)
MSWLSRLFGRRQKRVQLPALKPSAAPAPAPTTMVQRFALKISDTVLGMARIKPAKPVIFGLPQHPPSVGNGGAGAKMALDSDPLISQTNIWANQFVSFFDEGLTFLGYAYLSELAQRPEYRVMSETLAGEMTRKWIRFTANEDDDKSERIQQLEAEFKRLDIRGLFRKATEQDGFFGRGHIFLDTGDNDSPDELKKPIGDGWNKISQAKVSKAKPIKAMRTIEAVWCYPTEYDSNDPLKGDWYRPTQWFVQSKIVNSSRLITLIAREVPDLLKPTYSFGGLSLSQMAKPYVDNWLKTRQSVAEIISSFTVYVLHTNLGETLQADGDQLFRRVDLFNQMRNNRGTMVVDKESEDFTNVSAPLAGLHELQAQSQEQMASVSHIPTVKLLGVEPAGLNTTSEGSLRAFYDWIHSFQEKLYRAPLKTVLGFVMLSLWGEVDDGIDFEFVPLWSLDEKGEAEVEKTKAETDAILTDLGALDPKEVRKRVAADPGSDYASIDVEDMPELPEEFLDALSPEGNGPLDNAGERVKDGAERQSENQA